MAVTFLEPGGDATFNVASTTAGGFWATTIGGPSIATDFVNGNHINSIKFRANSADTIDTPTNSISDSGTRISMFIYLNALPGNTVDLVLALAGGFSYILRLTSGGVLQLWNSETSQIGTNGSTLSIGTWYRISLAYTITSTSVNRFELFKNGISDISVTNATLTTIGATQLRIGNISSSITLDLRISDIYIDNSSSLTDTGNIWVTAKRPNANGTANNFTTQIGSGGSGYGTGHSPQVNERPLSSTNGWSVVAVGATTEEYNIEGKSTGDINISNATTWDLLKEDGSNLLQENQSFILLQNENQNKVIDYMGWIDYKTVLSETASIVVNGVNSTFTSAANAETMFTKISGFGGYPLSTGTDIGMISDATATTVSLYECGIVIAYIPATASATVSPLSQEFMLMGVGT